MSSDKCGVCCWGKTQTRLGFGELVGLRDIPVPAWCPAWQKVVGTEEVEEDR